MSSTPGARASSSRARATVSGRANSALIDRLWPVKTGTRTQVPETSRSGSAEDLARLVAELLLLVGLEQPVVDDRAGQRQHVVGDRCGRTSPARGTSPPSRRRPARGPCRPRRRAGRPSSSTPARPLPETAWYVEAISRTRPGLVVQRLEHRHRGHGGAVGVGDDALARRPCLAIASGLTSETTSGTSGSIRQAEELSTTIAPAAANRGRQGPRGRGAGGEQRDVEPARGRRSRRPRR